MAKKLKLVEYCADDTLTQRLSKIRNAVCVQQKTKTAGIGKYSYKYVSEEEILNEITTYMEVLHISLRPNVKTQEIENVSHWERKKDNAGNDISKYVSEYCVNGNMVYTWVNDDTNESIDIDWAFIGSRGDASQAFGSALTYCNRYFILKFFNVATSNDDPDQLISRREDVLFRKEKEATEKVISDITVFAKKVSEVSPEMANDLVNTIKAFTKNQIGKSTANYALITKPDVAALLLSELHNKYDNKLKKEVK